MAAAACHVLARLFKKSEEEGTTHWRHILSAETEPVLHGLLFGNDPAGGGVGDDSWADLLEYAVGHGVAEETADVHLIGADLGGNLAICGG